MYALIVFVAIVLELSHEVEQRRLHLITSLFTDVCMMSIAMTLSVGISALGYVKISVRYDCIINAGKTSSANSISFYLFLLTHVVILRG